MIKKGFQQLRLFIQEARKKADLRKKNHQKNSSSKIRFQE